MKLLMSLCLMLSMPALGFGEMTPLHVAAGFGHVERIKLLLEEGADVNARDGYGQTPLHVAVSYRNVEAVKVLLEAGADVNAKKTEDGETPLHDASSGPPVEVVKVLVEGGCGCQRQGRGRTDAFASGGGCGYGGASSRGRQGAAGSGCGCPRQGQGRTDAFACGGEFLGRE